MRQRPSARPAMAAASILLLVSIGSAAVAQGTGDGRSAAEAVRRTDWTPMMPPGPGREYVVALCNDCHSVGLLALQKKSARGWRGFLLGINTAVTTSGELCACTGGPLDDTEIEVLTAYLAGTFNRQNPIDQLPLNVNTATPAALARLPGLSAADVQKLLAHRARTPFGSRREIQALLGNDTFRRIGGFVDVKDSLFRFEGMPPTESDAPIVEE